MNGGNEGVGERERERERERETEREGEVGVSERKKNGHDSHVT